MTDDPSASSMDQSFADRLNHLFIERLSPRGRPYVMREVSEQTGLSIAYISLLRKGRVAMPPADKVQALATFFDVDTEYLTGTQTDYRRNRQEVDPVLGQALSKPLVREVALRAGEVGEEERALILEMLERARQTAQRIRAQRAGESAQADADERTDDRTEMSPSDTEGQ